MKSKLFQILILLLLAQITLAAPPETEGKAVFTARCASCHAVNKTLTGPALAGVDERHSMDWIVNFVHASQTVIKSGDAQAVALFEKFNRIPMPDHPDLSAAAIKSVVQYIKSEAKTVAEKPPFVKPSKVRPLYTPLTFANRSFFAGYLGAVLLLVLALLFAVEIKVYERRLAPAMEDEA